MTKTGVQHRAVPLLFFCMKNNSTQTYLIYGFISMYEIKNHFEEKT